MELNATIGGAKEGGKFGEKKEDLQSPAHRVQDEVRHRTYTQTLMRGCVPIVTVTKQYVSNSPNLCLYSELNYPA